MFDSYIAYTELHVEQAAKVVNLETALVFPF